MQRGFRVCSLAAGSKLSALVAMADLVLAQKVARVMLAWDELVDGCSADDRTVHEGTLELAGSLEAMVPPHVWREAIFLAARIRSSGPRARDTDSCDSPHFDG